MYVLRKGINRNYLLGSLYTIRWLIRFIAESSLEAFANIFDIFDQVEFFSTNTKSIYHSRRLIVLDAEAFIISFERA